MMKKIQILPLIIAITIPLLIGGVSGYVTAEAIPTWYTTLNKPWFNPPNWLFGPVWTTLYIMMGLASYLIFIKDKSFNRTKSLRYYGIQLLLNFAWSIIFFGMQNPGAAFVEIITMWVFILLTILQFGKLNAVASWLMVPYITWVSFASILNFYIYMLN